MAKSTKYSAAAEACRREVVRMQSLADAAEVFDDLASADSLVESLKAQIGDLTKERTAVQADLEQTKLAVQKLRHDADDHMANANVLAGETVEKAKAEAEKIRKEAADRAALDLEAAKQEHANELAGVKNEITKAKQTLSDLQAKTTKAVADAQAAEKKAAEAQAAVDAIRAQAAKLAG